MSGEVGGVGHAHTLLVPLELLLTVGKNSVVLSISNSDFPTNNCDAQRRIQYEMQHQPVLGAYQKYYHKHRFKVDTQKCWSVWRQINGLPHGCPPPL